MFYPYRLTSHKNPIGQHLINLMKGGVFMARDPKANRFDQYLYSPKDADNLLPAGKLQGESWDEYIEKILESKGIPARGDFAPCNKIYRFKPWRLYDNPESGREFLFFIKPDLFIAKNKIKDESNVTLQPNLEKLPFWKDVARRYPHIIKQLQYSADPSNCPFSLLLTNMVDSNLDLPTLTANTITPAVNIFGTSYDYRGTSEPSDDNYDFSIDFADTRWLDV